MVRKRSRLILSIAAGAVVGLALLFAFWPRATMVDIGQVTTGPMRLTIDEEGRTRVHDSYMISAPVAGRLLRVAVEPGDVVIGGHSIVVRLLPAAPALLDIRQFEQARAAVAAAEAVVAQARFERAAAEADDRLAASELARTRRLFAADSASQDELERAQARALAARAGLDRSEAELARARADLAAARAGLIEAPGPQAPDGSQPAPVTLRAPVSGQVLRVLEKSETVVPAGAPVVEIGDVDGDLEVLAELLSTDAVQVAPGNRVLIEKWGGPAALDGVVERVEPRGFTKFSALGVEEQRVNTIIRFTEPPQSTLLGHGYRVEVRIIVWEDDHALIVPSSALFRDGLSWSVFVVDGGTARLRRVEIGRNNGVQAEVVSGLEAGERVILYPASELRDGMRVAQRQVD